MRNPGPNWVRLSRPGRKLDACWLHKPSGWKVHHCGHPTANWPYYAEHPDRPGKPNWILSGEGLGLGVGIRTLEQAFLHVEYYVATGQCRQFIRTNWPFTGITLVEGREMIAAAVKAMRRAG